MTRFKITCCNSTSIPIHGRKTFGQANASFDTVFPQVEIDNTHHRSDQLVDIDGDRSLRIFGEHGARRQR